MSEYNTEEYNERARDVRLSNFNRIMQEQFQLSYFGKISYEASDKMTVFERNTMYSILLEQKEVEKKARDEAIKKSKNSSSSYRRH